MPQRKRLDRSIGPFWVFEGSYTVEELRGGSYGPEGTVKYCLNGNNGQPCLAYSRGGRNWYVVSTEQPISEGGENVATGGTARANGSVMNNAGAANAFDDDDETPAVDNESGWIEYEFPTARTPRFIRILGWDQQGGSSGTKLPAEIKFFGSNFQNATAHGTEPSGTLLATFSDTEPIENWTHTTGDYYVRTFDLSNETAFDYIQIWYESVGQYIGLMTIKVFESEPA